jgi:hypothetical protein
MIDEIWRVGKPSIIVDIVIPINMTVDVPHGHLSAFGDDFVFRYIDKRFRLLAYKIEDKQTLEGLKFEQLTLKLRVIK